MSRLLVYVGFVGSTTIEEEMLFCRPLETNTKAEGVLKFVDAYFHEEDMKWEKLVGVCTDGVAAMLGCRSGFIATIKQKNSDVVETHCVIHRKGLQDFTCCNEKQACHNYTNCELYQSKCCQFPIVSQAM